MQKEYFCIGTADSSGAGEERAADAALANRLRRDDLAAMAELYDLYGTLTFSVLFRMVGNRSVAEDLTQEVFMRVWTSIGKFDARRASLKTWIVAIARNKAVDYWRSASARIERRGCGWDEAVGLPATGALEARLIKTASYEILREALQHLTERQQQVIRLTYFEGNTQREIAEQIRAPLGSVKTWVRSGIIELRKLLRNHPDFDFPSEAGPYKVCGSQC